MASVLFIIVIGVAILLFLVHCILHGRTLIRWLGILVLLLLAFSAINPGPCYSPREMERRELCMSNLYQIGIVARMYQQNNSNAFPQSILNLTNDLTVPKLFVCKSAGHAPGSITNLLTWSNYVFCFPPGSNGASGFVGGFLIERAADPC
jgi:hypothetical protein